MGEGIGKASTAMIYLELILSSFFSQADKSLNHFSDLVKNSLKAPGEHSAEFPGK